MKVTLSAEFFAKAKILTLQDDAAYVPPSPPADNEILLESGAYLLLENDAHILLEG